MIVFLAAFVTPHAHAVASTFPWLLSTELRVKRGVDPLSIALLVRDLVRGRQRKSSATAHAMVHIISLAQITEISQ